MLNYNRYIFQKFLLEQLFGDLNSLSHGELMLQDCALVSRTAHRNALNPYCSWIIFVVKQ